MDGDVCNARGGGWVRVGGWGMLCEVTRTRFVGLQISWVLTRGSCAKQMHRLLNSDFDRSPCYELNLKNLNRND